MGRRGRRARRAGLVLVLLLVVLAVVMAYQGFRAFTALRDLQSQAGRLQQQVRAQDVAGARATAVTVRADARTARSHTDNVLWDAAAHVPWLGHDVEAVQVIARAADQIASSSTGSALDLLTTVRTKGALRTSDGRFRLDTIAALAPRFERLDAGVRGPAAAVAALRTDQLLGPLRGPVADVQDKVAEVAGSARAGATATRLLPSMLGGSGPRTYLLVVQNNAEVRATGGLPGALALLKVRDGRLELGRQLATPDFTVQRRPVLPTTSQERALFGDGYGTDVRDLNLDPDFPRAAQMFAAMVRTVQGVRVDGVIALDPVMLSEVMGATGPVTFSTARGQQRLTAQDVVPTLLHDVYLRYANPRDQDAFFAAAAQGVFSSLVTQEQDPAALLSPVARASQQRRVLVWSAVPREQALLQGTTVSGSLPSDTGTSPQVGVYLNDGTAGKMDYYLRYRGSTASLSCSGSGAQDVAARLSVRSVAPQDAAGLPPYVTGLGQYAPRGDTRLNLRIYAPKGGRILSVSAGGKRLPLQTLEHEGHQVAFVGLLLQPGGRVDLEAVVRTRAGQDGAPELRLTPGVEDRSYDATAPSACS